MAMHLKALQTMGVISDAPSPINTFFFLRKSSDFNWNIAFRYLFVLAIFLTRFSHLRSSEPAPPIRRHLPPLSALSCSYLAKAWRLTLCRWLMAHHRMLSREKLKTILKLSSQSGLHDSKNPSNLPAVRQHRRGKYTQNGGSSPIKLCQWLASNLHKDSLQMMSVASSSISVPVFRM